MLLRVMSPDGKLWIPINKYSSLLVCKAINYKISIDNDVDNENIALRNEINVPIQNLNTGSHELRTDGILVMQSSEETCIKVLQAIADWSFNVNGMQRDMEGKVMGIQTFYIDEYLKKLEGD